MKRTLPLLLIVCILFGMALPVTASAAVDSVGIGFSETAIPEEPTSLGKSDEPICEPQGILPTSGFEGENSEFFTRIRLTVTDRNGNPISGAVYGLYRIDDDGVVEYLTTDYYGVAVSGDVPVNTDYYLLEEFTPEGFLPNTERKNIMLADVCAPSRVDVSAKYDAIIGRIRINKVDEDGNPLPGAGFYIYRQNPWELVETLTTDAGGTAITGDLPYGMYEIYEYAVPDGFFGAGWEYVFIGNHEQTEEINITNYKAHGSVRIYKTGNDERNIQGAEFSIYHADTDVWIEDITTNSGGYAYSSSLLLGDYYALEKSVPSGYILDTAKQPFTISYSDQTVYLNIQNKRSGESGKIRITKTDDSANPLSGVVFGIYRAWDDKKMGEVTTGADGTAVSDFLIPQDYYLVELTGKPGYTMVLGHIPFTIDGSGTTVTKTVENPKIHIFGKVKITKKDDAGNHVSGVRFGVYCDQGILLDELTTGADGTATSGVLNEGNGYYIMELESAPGYVCDLNAKYAFDITQNEVTVPVTVINPRIAGNIKVLKDDGKGNPLPGVVFGIYTNGVKVSEITTGTDGSALSDTLFYGDYELKELSTASGYELITTPIPFSITEQGVVLEIPVSNPLILGSVKVIKTGENNALLSGAVFGLYNSKGQKIKELVTGKDGTAVYTGLPQASYFLKELTAPEGYVLSDELIPFDIVAQGDMVEKTVANARGFGYVNIIKTGEKDAPLSDVVFEVYRTATYEKVMELTTGKDGTVKQKLPLGQYYLKEIATNKGYLLPTGSISFSLTNADAIVTLPIQNQKAPILDSGKLILTKKADDTGEKLKDAVFAVYRLSDDEKLEELTTDAYGEASISLPAGEYYLREAKAPKGYILNTDRIGIKIKADEVKEITVTNKADTTEKPQPTEKPGKLIIYKKADSTGEKLKGAVFALYRTSDDEKLEELTTDAYGEASISLPAGEYYLREIQAPKGYILTTDRIGVKIKAGEVKEITVVNKADITEKPQPTEKPGKLIIYKKADSTGDKLKGAVFALYRTSDDEKLEELTTDNNGEATVSLPAGDYYLREVKAPSGYKLNSDRIGVKIKAGGVTEITITNIKESKPVPGQNPGSNPAPNPNPAPESTPKPTAKGELLISKKAELTGKPLSGAVFGVYVLSGDKKVTELTTNAEGKASYALEPGEYYLKELKAPYGYVLESAKIYFTITANVTVKAEVTNQRDANIPNSSVPIGTITIPKTGEDFPWGNYSLSVFLFAVTILCGLGLRNERKRQRIVL